MPSASQSLRDQQIQHAIHLLGYTNAVQRDILALLNDLAKDSVAKIGSGLAGVKTGRKMSAKETDNLNRLIDEVQSMTTGVYDKAHDHLRREFVDFAQSEAEFANKAVNAATRSKIANRLPAPARLKAIVTSDPINGEILEPWLKRMGQETGDRVARQIRLGAAAGERVDAIVERVVGKNGFEGSRNSARTMVRTSLTAIAAQTQQETWAANSDIIKGWQFVATLDSRTTTICASIDGKVFKLGEGPMPPRHPNCRSSMIAVTKAFDELGIKGEKYTPTTRASMDGQVAASTRFEDFLRTKDEAFQNDIFRSSTRADLWRRGKLNINDFVRNYSEVIPLDELRRLHPDAFAGTVVDEVVETVARTLNPALPIAHGIKRSLDSDKLDALDALERDYVLNTGRETGTEHLVAYDARTGEVIERKEGERSFVSFSPSLVAAVDDPSRAIVLHHNHPSSSSLSLPDINVVTKRKGAAAIYAHGHNGSVFYARRGKRAFRKTTVDAVASAIQRSLQVMVNRGVLAIPDAQLMHNHLTWLHLHHLEEIYYVSELQGTSLDAWNRNKATFELILEKLRG